MSYLNPDIQLNNLNEEIIAIGEYVGYYWDLIPNDASITVSGENNDFKATVSNGNNTSYAYSSLKRNDLWSCSCSITDNSYMAMGISTNLTASFPNPSAPSMKMMNYGMIVDRQNANGCWQVVNGVITGTATTYNVGDVLKMEYNGTTLSYSINDNPVFSNVSVALDSVNLVIASYYGGTAYNISFPGTGGGGGSGSTVNLKDVLTNGNNGGNIGMTNVGSITTNGACFFEGGIAVGGRGVGINQGSQYQVESNNGFYYIQNGNINDLEIGYEDSNNIQFDMLSANFSNMTFTFGDQSQAYPTVPTLQLQGYSNGVPITGNVIDTLQNPAVFLSRGSNAGFTSKAITIGQATSFLKIDLGKPNYGLHTMNIDNFYFTATVAPASQQPITAQLYLSTTQDDSVASAVPLNVIYSINQNLNPVGGTPFFQINSPITLSRGSGNNSQYVYIGIKFISTDEQHTVNLTNCQLDYTLMSQPCGYSSITPSVIT